jgi:hypothetical protein
VIAEAAVAAAFSFGRHGGNIIPFHARIAASGRVTVDDKARGVLKQTQLAALQRLVERERFAALPTRITCAGVLPDVATRSITATSHGKRHSVSVHGGCSRRFDRVYAALAKAVGLQ